MKTAASRILLALVCGVIAFAAIAYLATRFNRPLTALGTPSAPTHPAPADAKKPAPLRCLAAGDGFFKARLDGALQTDLHWANEGTACEGGPRPEGKGIRLSFTRQAPDEEQLLIVLGIAGVSESSSGKALPANLTVIDERHDRVFGTLGDDKCTVDEVRQELIGAWSKHRRTYRVSGRGFCMQPARAVTGGESVLMSTFDFAGRVLYQ